MVYTGVQLGKKYDTEVL